MTEINNLNRRISLLKEARRSRDELLSLIPERSQVLKIWPQLRHDCGYFERGTIRRTFKKGTDTFVETHMQSGIFIDWQRFVSVGHYLYDRLRQCDIEYHDSYNIPIEWIGDARLIKVRQCWPIMESLKLVLDWELKEAETAITSTRKQVSPNEAVAPGAESLVNDAMVAIESSVQNRPAMGAKPQHLNPVGPETPLKDQTKKNEGTNQRDEFASATTPVAPKAAAIGDVHTFAEWMQLLAFSPRTWTRRRKDFASCFTDIPCENACSIREPELSQWLASAKNKQGKPFGGT